MSRVASFKQSDLTRALKAAKAAGLDVSGFKFDPKSGEIAVFAGARSNGALENDLDRELREFEKNHG